MSGPRSGSCISNVCMKLSFEEPGKSMRVCEGVAIPAQPVTSCPSRVPQNRLRAQGGGQTVRSNDFRSERRGASHELRYVRPPERMARARAGVHEDACPAGGADL